MPCLFVVQIEASSARECIVAQVNTVREALEEEEQRLLEAVQREEERMEQCLLTQQAHWSQALDTVTRARTSLVHTLTHSTDAMLVVRGRRGTRYVWTVDGGENADCLCSLCYRAPIRKY